MSTKGLSQADLANLRHAWGALVSGGTCAVSLKDMDRLERYGMVWLKTRCASNGKYTFKMTDEGEELVFKLGRIHGPVGKRLTPEDAPLYERDIRDMATCENLSDMDIFVIFRLGLNAFKQAKKLGAKFPHE